MQETSAYAPASCGEWLQGWQDGEPVLVSCPIDCGARAVVRAAKNGGGVTVTPPQRSKAARAAALLLERARTDSSSAAGWEISIEDALPVGRGYATSTADLSAAAAALAAAAGLNLSPAEIAALACAVEPSDSVMFPGLCLLAYRSAARHMPLGEAPHLTLVILDEGAPVDSVEYNRYLDLERIRALEGDTRRALEALQEGIRRGEADLLGEAARISAAAYQKVVHSPLTAWALDWAVRLKAGGPLRAHSGSLAGLLFEDEDEARAAARRLEPVFRGEIRLAHTAPGGVILYAP